jgi:hypothetical protein
VAADWDLPLLIRRLLGADTADSGCQAGACTRQGEGEGEGRWRGAARARGSEARALGGEGAGRRKPPRARDGEAAARTRVGAIEQGSPEATTVQTRLRGLRPPQTPG